MPATTSITESIIFQTLGNVLKAILPASMSVVRGQQNRVAEPSAADYAVMWPLLRPRLSQNVDSYSDIAFVGSIAGTTLTVSQVLLGTLVPNLVLSALGITANTSILSQLSGAAGGVGTYQLSVSQTLTSRTFQAGSKGLLQTTQVTIQVDIHGPNSADNAQIISTLLRDSYGVALFNQYSPVQKGIEPLYCNDPRQMPFMDSNQQSEERWVVEVVMQCNPIVSVPQDYAGALAVTVKSVDAFYQV